MIERLVRPGGARFVGAILLAAGVATGAGAESAPSAPSGRAMVTLEDAETGRYLDVLEELVALGLEAKPTLSGGAAASPSELTAYTDRMQRAIESGGFTFERFSEVHWSAMMAYAALELDGQRAEIEAAQAQQKAQLEAMRGSMSEAQYRQMMQAMGAIANMGPLSEIPDGNRETVAKYRARIDALVNDSR